MKISIITVCYNSEETIRDTIESVLQQTYTDIEYIIVDGGSRDSTLAIVAEYDDKIAKVISEPDQGIYDAMNKGVVNSTGDYVGILNSDDVFASRDAVQSIADYLIANPSCEALYGDLVYVERDDVDKVVRQYSSKSFSPWKLRFGFMVPHPTFYTRRENFEKFGLYKLGYRVSADFELMARFMLGGLRFERLPKVLVKMRQGGISTTGIWWRVHQNMEIVRACKENGLYTNLLMVAMKVPFKLASYFSR